MKKFGFGVIGVGGIGPFHIKGILDNSDKAKLIAVSDMKEEMAKKIALENNIDYYTDYKEMLKRSDIDVVCVATPTGTHGTIAIDCANAGKHVLVEKPLDITLEKCDAVIAACRKQKVKLGVIFQSRTYTDSIKIKSELENGRLGKLIIGDICMKWLRTQSYYDSGKWRGTWEMDGGGCLMNQAIHYIDLLQWFMGSVDTVTAQTATMLRKIEVEDVGMALIKFKNGAFGIIEASTAVYPGTGNPGRIEIHGENGTIIYENGMITHWDIEGEEKKDSKIERKDEGFADPLSIPSQGHKVQIADMCDAIENNREPLVTGEEARKSVEIILAIYKSSKLGMTVKLPL
ncbi:MAG: Gfo/Idh/MocA family oxidoreductase [Candidatus Firestonebacteria bacterium]